jgi:hypothetical protein
MGVALYLDVHVPAAIAERLRQRQVDVLTAIEDGWQQRSDEERFTRFSSGPPTPALVSPPTARRAGGGRPSTCRPFRAGAA